MKHCKAILSMILIVSLLLGVTVIAHAEDTPLTVTRVVDVGGKLDIYFSEPVQFGSARPMMGIAVTNADATAIVNKIKSGNTVATWERNDASLVLAADGSKITVDWTVTPEIADFVRKNEYGTLSKYNNKYQAFARDVGANGDADGYINYIVAKSDSSKALKANRTIANKDYLFADIEWSRPVLTGVDKVGDMGYAMHFSEPIAIASGMRVVLRLLNPSTLALVNGYQYVYDATQSATKYTLSDDQKTINVTLDSASIDYILDKYSVMNETGCDIYLQLLDGTDNNPFYMDLITAVDNGAAAYAEHNGGTASDAVSWCVTDMIYAQARITGSTVGYPTVQAALNAATPGKTVRLLMNVADAGTLVVPAGVTFNLNGYTCTADNLISFGQVDDTKGTGVLAMSHSREEAVLSLMADNAKLPLYDAGVGGYKFYEYELTNLGIKESDTTADSVKFGMRLTFTKEEAYDLLADEGLELGMNITVKRNGKESLLKFPFSAETVAAYAEGVSAGTADAITLTISGLSLLSAGDTVTVAPTLLSNADVATTASAVTHAIA